MQLENKTFYVASVLIVHDKFMTECVYVVSTNAGIHVAHLFDDLPEMVKQYIDQYQTNAIHVTDSVICISRFGGASH